MRADQAGQGKNITTAVTMVPGTQGEGEPGAGGGRGKGRGGGGGAITTEVAVSKCVLSTLMVPSYVTRITPITIITPHHHRSYPGVSAARPRPPRPARLGSRRWPPRRRHPAADRESKVCGPVDFLPCSWWGPPGRRALHASPVAPWGFLPSVWRGGGGGGGLASRALIPPSRWVSLMAVSCPWCAPSIHHRQP